MMIKKNIYGTDLYWRDTNTTVIFWLKSAYCLLKEIKTYICDNVFK